MSTDNANLVKGGDVRSETKANALHGQLRQAQESVAKLFQPFIISQSELALEYLIPIRNLMNYAQVYNYLSRGMVASSLVCSTLDQVIQKVRALARDIMLCSWTRHLSLTVPLSTQMYEWISATAN